MELGTIVAELSIKLVVEWDIPIKFFQSHVHVHGDW